MASSRDYKIKKDAQKDANQNQLDYITKEENVTHI